MGTFACASCCRSVSTSKTDTLRCAHCGGQEYLAREPSLYKLNHNDRRLLRAYRIADDSLPRPDDGA